MERNDTPSSLAEPLFPENPNLAAIIRLPDHCATLTEAVDRGHLTLGDLLAYPILAIDGLAEDRPDWILNEKEVIERHPQRVNCMGLHTDQAAYAMSYPGQLVDVNIVRNPGSTTNPRLSMHIVLDKMRAVQGMGAWLNQPFDGSYIPTENTDLLALIRSAAGGAEAAFDFREGLRGHSSDKDDAVLRSLYTYLLENGFAMAIDPTAPENKNRVYILRDRPLLEDRRYCVHGVLGVQPSSGNIVTNVFPPTGYDPLLLTAARITPLGLESMPRQ